MPFLLILIHIFVFIGKILPYEDTDDDNGGHSAEFKPMGYEWNIKADFQSVLRRLGDLDYTQEQLHKIHTLYKRNPELPLDNRALSSNVMSFIADFLKFFKALPEVLKAFETDLERILRKNRINGIVTGRIKGLESLLNKMDREGINDFKAITDIVGCRVTLQTIDDILKFKNAYLRAFNKSVNEIKCYGVCGPSMASSDPRVRNYWPWRGSGYRRLHLKVAVPELETVAEIQIGTPYMTLWAAWEHAVVYKGPAKLQQDSNVVEYTQRLAEYYMMLDNIRDKINPKCPQVLRKTNPKEIFSDKDWKAFGSPFNACHFWNYLRTNMP
ncbi:hypothetical protein ACROYT_G044137 [Oculina patagonica]